MVKNITLVSNTPIVIQIFNLVCKKLNLELEVLSEAQIDHNVDIIIVDKELIDDRFNIFKDYCKLLGAISNEYLPSELQNDFTIPKPFLPSSLEVILTDQLNIIKNSQTPTPETKAEETIIATEDESELDVAVEYLESLADNIASDVNEEADDSVVSTASVIDTRGGILDKDELSKIEDIINPVSHNGITETCDANEDSDWMDLSEIIDQAIDEINTTSEIAQQYEKKPIKLLLNNYSMHELRPLFNLLNQDIIDSLTNGEEVSLQLKLGEIDE